MPILLRWLTGAACAACLVMAVAVFPLAGVWERPQSLLAPFICLLAAAYLGSLAVLGRTPRWPSEKADERPGMNNQSEPVDEKDRQGK
jgi:hypothetical protein